MNAHAFNLYEWCSQHEAISNTLPLNSLNHQPVDISSVGPTLFQTAFR